jgi:hypothetical protein
MEMLMTYSNPDHHGDNRLLKDLTTNNDKYIVDEEFQQVLISTSGYLGVESEFIS